ncbi:MAG: hypothetical protein OEW35_07545 [Gammaproteobacteria bacterium]|nr:hypothetical protein [Gammaproteobacteria bacterium]MDH4254102.1 hypothetical protein [Gammaproteobacteria bacterium]MDH5309050.1 hypothetical protein [Gammaproteobacteria bacterium]
MTFQIEYEMKPGYLHARVSGTNARQVVKAYLKEIREECMRRGCEKVLIEENLRGERLDTMEVFDIASEGSLEALGWFEAVAYVDPHMHDLREFAETVAINRGMPVAIFESVEKAAAWLDAQQGGSREKYIFTDGDSSAR